MRSPLGCRSTLESMAARSQPHANPTLGTMPDPTLTPGVVRTTDVKRHTLAGHSATTACNTGSTERRSLTIGQQAWMLYIGEKQ